MPDQIEQLIKQLGDNTRQKRRAVSQLMRIGEPALEPLLKELERTNDETVQKAALLILNRIGDKRAVPALKYLLFNTEPDFRTLTPAMVLAKLGALEPLREALQAPDPLIRRLAVEAIGTSGQLSDIKLLAPLLNDHDDTVRYAAVTAISRSDDSDVINLLCQDNVLRDERMVYAAVKVLWEHDRDCLFETIYKILPDADEGLRIRLLSAMSSLNDERTTQFRLLMLEDDNSKVRSFAPYQLVVSGITTNKIDDSLIAALDDTDVDVRRQATWSLGKLGNETHFDLLVQKLQDKSSGVRGAAAEALGYLRDQRAVEHLIPLLQDPRTNVRETASRVLRILGDTRAVQPLMQTIRDYDSQGISGWSMSYDLAALGGASVVDSLIDMLHSDRLSTIITAADTISHLCDERATQPLIELLSHTDDHVRESAARALYMIGNPTAINALVELVDDEDYNVKIWAIGALPFLEDKEYAISVCVREFERSSGWPQQDHIIFVLGRIGGNQVVPILIDILQDESNERRFMAAGELGRIGDQRAVDPLIAALNQSTSERVVAWAARALGQMSAKQAVPALIETLYEVYDNDPGYSSELLAIIEALGQIQDRRAVQTIVETLNSARPEIKIAAAYALRNIGDERASSALVPLLNHISPNVRQAGASALRKIGDESAVEGLIGSLQDNNIIVRALTTEALARIGDPRATDALIQALYDDRNRIRKAAARGLVKIGLDALPSLLRVEVDDNHDARANRKLVWILGELGDSSATEKLMSIAENISDMRTRSYAIEALGKIGDPRSLKVILNASNDTSSYIRAPAATAMVNFRQLEVIERLKILIQDDNENVRRAAKRSLELLDIVSDET